MEATSILFDEDDVEIVAQNAHESIVRATNGTGGKWGGSRPGKTQNRLRNFAQVHEDLMDEYFRAENEPRSDGSGFNGPRCSEDLFERRYRMPRSVYNRVFEKVTTLSQVLVLGDRCDASGRKGISALVKVTAALRML